MDRTKESQVRQEIRRRWGNRQLNSYERSDVAHLWCQAIREAAIDEVQRLAAIVIEELPRYTRQFEQAARTRRS